MTEVPRKKFRIKYPEDHPNPKLRGKRFKGNSGKDMIVMNGAGIFFMFNGETYYPGIQPLSNVLPKYDVEWVE